MYSLGLGISTLNCSLHLNWLWLSAMISIFFRKKHWWGVRAPPLCKDKYSHTQELCWFSKVGGSGFSSKIHASFPLKMSRLPAPENCNCMDMFFLCLGVFLYGLIKDLVYNTDLGVFSLFMYVYNSKICSSHGISQVLHAPFLVLLFFSFSLLVWSNPSILSSSPDTLSSVWSSLLQRFPLEFSNWVIEFFNPI